MAKRKKKVPKFIIFLFIFGFLVGGVSAYFLTKNDCFILNGDKEITLNLNEVYEEKGVKVVAYGKDLSSEVIIVIYNENDEKVENVSTLNSDEYTIVYQVSSSKYVSYKLIRKVKVVDNNA